MFEAKTGSIAARHGAVAEFDHGLEKLASTPASLDEIKRDLKAAVTLLGVGYDVGSVQRFVSRDADVIDENRQIILADAGEKLSAVLKALERNDSSMIPKDFKEWIPTINTAFWIKSSQPGAPELHDRVSQALRDLDLA